MSQILNVEQFTARLTQAAACEASQAVSFDGILNDHLITHYLRPFLNGETPCVGDLDYSQISSDDVDEFREYLNKVELVSCKLMNLCKTYLDAESVTVVGIRAFC